MIWYPEIGDKVKTRDGKGVIIGWQANANGYSWLVHLSSGSTIYMRQIDLVRVRKGWIMENRKLEQKYRCIMRIFHEGFEDETVSYIEDGWGEYIAYKRLFGVNVVYSQDDMGFKDLSVYSDKELETLIAVYSEPEEDDFFG